MTIKELFEKADPDASAASWAIRFAASLENVMVVLSGMSSLAQMQDNVSYMKDFRPLDEEERKVIAKAQEILSGMDQMAGVLLERETVEGEVVQALLDGTWDEYLAAHPE